jgi:hypothetical protein
LGTPGLCGNPTFHGAKHNGPLRVDLTRSGSLPERTLMAQPGISDGPDLGSYMRRLSGQDHNVLLHESTILHTDFEAETRGILRGALTVIDVHANGHSDTFPMRGNAGRRVFATK